MAKVELRRSFHNYPELSWPGFWQAVPMPLSGVCGDGTALDARILDLIATAIECCEPSPKPAPGHPPTQTVRVLATLRRFLREGRRGAACGQAGTRRAARPCAVRLGVRRARACCARCTRCSSLCCAAT